MPKNWQVIWPFTWTTTSAPAWRRKRRQALIQLGGVTQAQERQCAQHGFPGLDTLSQDLRYGVCMLRKHKGLTAVAGLTLALGLGVNTVVFSMVYRMLFQPLPYPQAEQLAVVS